MICSKCGQENEDGSKFCVFCGYSFTDGEAANEGVPNEDASNVKTEDLRAAGDRPSRSSASAPRTRCSAGRTKRNSSILITEMKT